MGCIGNGLDSSSIPFFTSFNRLPISLGLFEKWNQLTYFYFFYSVEALSLGLSFVVIYEVSLSVLEPYDAMRRVGSKIFFCSGAALFLIGILFLIFGPASEGGRLFRIVFYSERSLRIVGVGGCCYLLCQSH